MKIWIALLRGVNVGGNNRLNMAELKSDLELLKIHNVQTCIQSGNVVFESASGSSKSQGNKSPNPSRSDSDFGRKLLSSKRKNFAGGQIKPVPGGYIRTGEFAFLFLEEPAIKRDTEAIAKAISPTERCQLVDRVFYLHAPDGIGRSRLAANAEKYLGVVATSRNYRTVEKLVSMSQQY